MPETEQPPEQFLPADNTIFAVLALVVSQCFSPELLHRYKALVSRQPDYIINQMFTVDSKGHSATVELGILDIDGVAQQTYIDNVEHVGHDTVIKLGANIGPYCILGTRVTIEEGAELGVACNVEHGVTIGRETISEDGVTVSTGASIGKRSILRQNCEVGYDLDIPPYSVIKPGSVVTKGYLDDVNFGE